MNLRRPRPSTSGVSNGFALTFDFWSSFMILRSFLFISAHCGGLGLFAALLPPPLLAPSLLAPSLLAPSPASSRTAAVAPSIIAAAVFPAVDSGMSVTPAVLSVALGRVAVLLLPPPLPPAAVAFGAARRS